MSTWIKEDFKPAKQSYDNLAKHGAIKEFCDDQHDYFMTYWLDLKEKKQARGRKTSWDMTWQRWMRSAWNGKTGRNWERERHYTSRPISTPKPVSELVPDLFSENARERATVCGRASARNEKRKCTGTDLSCPDRSRSSIRGQPIDYPIHPKEQKPMTAEQAFAELRKQGII